MNRTIPRPDSYRFPLWKENKVEGEYHMTLEEFKPKFFEWVKQQDKDWLRYYGSMGAIQKFIGDISCLNSVIEPDMYDILVQETKDEFWNITESK